MAVLKQLVWALAVALPVLAAPGPVAKVPKLADYDSRRIDSGDALREIAKLAYDNTAAGISKPGKRAPGSSCTLSKLRIRKEWRTISKPERRSYIAAVKCLTTAPSLLDPVAFPASKSLFDDFVSIHLMQTLNIHLSGTFLSWHRYFTYTFEEKLRTVCGYTGAFPYWEWGLDVNNPAASPVFDGSDTSLGGNGKFFPHPGMILTEALNPAALIPLPPGTGGGCVETGPFANFTVNIGPIAVAQYGNSTAVGVPDPFSTAHARCLKRDLNAGVAKRWTTFLNTTKVILQNPNVELFQAHLQADPRYVHGELGVHGGGHFIIGGDPGSDPFISPGDPAFYLHHGQVDRVWWIWQMLDYPNRKTVFGSEVFMDLFPSPNVTLSTVIDIQPLAPPVTVGDLMSTTSGPFCYIYL